MSDGPLTKLMRALGVESDLAPLASVKRITERPVSLNPELLFKMTPSPMQKSPAEFNQLFDGGPVLPTDVPERFLSARRRRMVYDRIPVGHNTGWRCYDGTKHDAESAFEAGEFGDGMSQDEAYCAWLREIDEPEPHATSAERELDEAIDEALDFDADLEDRNER
jgi:hypothetical protein